MSLKIWVPKLFVSDSDSGCRNMLRMQLPRPHELPDLPPPYAQPQHLTSFSYDGSRHLLLPSSGFHDHTLRLYKDPPLRSDLRRGFDTCVWRDERIVEGLDSLLKWSVYLDFAQVLIPMSSRYCLVFSSFLRAILRMIYSIRLE